MWVGSTFRSFYTLEVKVQNKIGIGSCWRRYRMRRVTDDFGLAARSDDGNRLIAIGDIHGDLGQAKKVLQLMKVVDENGTWAAGRSTVIQTGDLVDRGPDSLEVVKLFEDLKVC